MKRNILTGSLNGPNSGLRISKDTFFRVYSAIGIHEKDGICSEDHWRDVAVLESVQSCFEFSIHLSI